VSNIQRKDRGDERHPSELSQKRNGGEGRFPFDVGGGNGKCGRERVNKPPFWGNHTKQREQYTKKDEKEKAKQLPC